MAKTLGFDNFTSYCISKGVNPEKVVSLKSFGDKQEEYESLKSEFQKIKSQKNIWKSATILGFITTLIISIWFFIKLQGKHLSQIADSNSIAKYVIGNWYSYNRTYESRKESKDPGVYNRMAWRFYDENGFIKINRYWKVKDFDGYTAVPEGEQSQLHFFLNVYPYDNGYKNPIGFRHFICTKWGKEKDDKEVDTLICVCTSYTFKNGELGNPLAIREILIKQKDISYDSLKKGVASLPDTSVWLRQFFPKGKSYIYQDPIEDSTKIVQPLLKASPYRKRPSN